jgi:hypothetical protein
MRTQTFEAERKFEQYEQNNGKVENHQFAKELLAGFAGAEVQSYHPSARDCRLMFERGL